jgi:uncharacterized membrane protein YkvA (DUF1232 family)
MSNTSVKSDDLQKHEKDFNDSGFWSKVSLFGKKLGMKPLYIAFLLYYSLPKASLVNKAIIIGSLGYLISPLDLIPDCIPVIGLMGDASALMFAYYRIQNEIDDETREKAKTKLKSIFGSIDEKLIEEL